MAATLPTLVLTSLLPKAVQKRAEFAFILRMPEKMPVRDWFRLHWWARQAVQCTPRVKLHEVKNETGDVFKPMRLIGSATVETREAMEFLT